MLLKFDDDGNIENGMHFNQLCHALYWILNAFISYTAVAFNPSFSYIKPDTKNKFQMKIYE